MRTPLVLITLLLTSAVRAGTPLPDGPHVATRGEGKARSTPDLATIDLQVAARADQPAAAKQKVDGATDAVLKATSHFGVAQVDIDASALRIEEDVEVTDAGRRVSNGFEATRRIEVKLRDLSKFSDFFDAVLQPGNTTVSNIRFDSSRKDALLAQARAEAVGKARERADGLAQAFGARLGRVYSIDSVGSSKTDRYSLDRIEVTGSRMRTARDIQPEVEYTEAVEAVFDLRLETAPLP